MRFGFGGCWRTRKTIFLSPVWIAELANRGLDNLSLPTRGTPGFVAPFTIYDHYDIMDKVLGDSKLLAIRDFSFRRNHAKNQPGEMLPPFAFEGLSDNVDQEVFKQIPRQNPLPEAENSCLKT